MAYFSDFSSALPYFRSLEVDFEFFPLFLFGYHGNSICATLLDFLPTDQSKINQRMYNSGHVLSQRFYSKNYIVYKF